MAKLGISIRDAARRLTASGYEIDESSIRKWIRKGLVKTLEDGSLDPAMLEAQVALVQKKQNPIWGGKRQKGQIGPAPMNDRDPGAIRTESGNVISFERARTSAEIHRSRLLHLEYEKETRNLVARYKVEKALTDLGALARAVLERIPDHLAPILAAETDSHKARQVLLAALNEAMTEIAGSADRIGQGLAE